MAKKKSTKNLVKGAKPKRPPNVVAHPAIPETGSARFPVVGLGASAGGVEAMIEFFRAMKLDCSMAFAVVMHLDPEHKSAFPEILSKITRMPVAEAKDGVTVERNKVYVLPPNAEMIIERGILRLAPRSGSRPPMPIDTFFLSLADDVQGQAVGVILSGTGSDGTRGLRAIKGAGGVTFVQDHSATYAGMPRSALNAGCVDFTLPPRGIAAELARLKNDGYLNLPPDDAVSPAVADADEFAAIIRHLSRSTGVEFNHYKVSTLQRRVQRRMMARKLTKLKAYLACLRDDAQEVNALFDESLIQVTSFFRDPEAFQTLTQTVLPRLFEDRPPLSPIRVWVPGCATGEEVYSIVICLLDFLNERSDATPIKIFGTDINERALMVARSGIYSEGIAADLSPQRLRRYLEKTDTHYQIQKRVRDLCVFARQDVTHDPPFSQLDLISCRNVLIYLGPALQNRVLPTFHYALRPNGFLMLGMSESIGNHSDLFDVVDKKHKIYRRSAKASRLSFEFHPDRSARVGIAVNDSVEERGNGALDLQREADRVVLARYAPSGVVVDENLHVIQFRGHTGSILEPAPGSPSFDLFQLAREGLLSDLRDTVQKAMKTSLPARAEKVRIRSNGDVKEFNLEVLPMASPSSGGRYYVILFEDAEIFPAALSPEKQTMRARDKAAPDEETDRNILRLKQELAATRAYLQSVIEEKEAANEELKAANEEIVSSNEELQSTNEELETAKEELQATNEELTTVNDELQHRINVASELSDDLTNLVESLDTPVIVVSDDLRLRRVTPAALQVLNLRPTDTGRSISDFKLNLNVTNLEELIRDVVVRARARRQEVANQNGRAYEMNIVPYRRDGTKIDGALVAFFDISAMKQRERMIQEATDFANSILNTVRMPVLTVDAKLRVNYANAAYYSTFQQTAPQTEKKLLYELLDNGAWASDALREKIEETIRHGIAFADFELHHDFPKIGERVFLVHARVLVERESEATVITLVAFEDITERRRLEKQVLEVADQEQRRIGEDLHDGIGQEITGLIMIADSMVKRLQKEKSEVAAVGADVRDGLDRVHQQVRALSRGLIPVQVGGGELTTALQELAARTSTLGCDCRFDGDAAANVDDATMGTHLYRIAQEAVSNSLRHSHAKHIVIRLRRDADAIALTVSDDGTGIADAVLMNQGVGISIMRHRASLIGATLAVSRAKKGGTVIACRLTKA